MLTLFRTVTGESWNGIMHDLMHAGHSVATPFFVSFVVLGSFIMLNLFVAVILENYVDAQNEDREAVESADLTKEFAKVWAKLDPDKVYFIESFKLVYLLYNIDPPLGLKGMEHKIGRWSDDMVLLERKKKRRSQMDRTNNRKSSDLLMPYQKKRMSNSVIDDRGKEKIHVIEFIRQVGIKRDENGLCFYLDVLNALSKQAFNTNQHSKSESDTELKVEQMDAVNGELMSGMKDELRRKMLEMSSTTMLCDLTAEYNAASLIQCRYRGKIVRREFYKNTVAEGKWTNRMEVSERSDR